MSLAQLSRLLPLPSEELKQVLEYASTLSKPEAAEHFTNLLGDSPQAIDFVASFNSRRADPHVPSSVTQVSAKSASKNGVGSVSNPQRTSRAKKEALHTAASRPVASLGSASGRTYNKKDQQDDYISGRSGVVLPTEAGMPSSSALTAEPFTAPPSGSSRTSVGTLVSELGLPKQKAKTNTVPRTGVTGSGAKNATTTRISIVGGTPMHGASTALTDLDDAIRALELTTNPSHTSNSAAAIAARRCNCVATRHPLQVAAPNCLSCGKVICVKEGLGPCTFCGVPLLSSSDVQVMIKELKYERGQEKMAANREAHKRADVASTPRHPYGGREAEGTTAAEAKAREHRDRLLGFQAQNAKRTTVRDEAADFDVSHMGNMWSSPEERARELKKQQKLLREMEWNARPDYEKRRQVLSIDLAGGKVVKRMATVERPPSPGAEADNTEGDKEPDTFAQGAAVADRASTGGAFSQNPLLRGVIKPVYEVKGKGLELEGRKKSTRWRRAQDNLDDSEPS